MSIKVSPFMGGLGLDATNKFEIQDNATVTVGNGTTTGNIVVGTITAGTFNGLSSNSIGDSDSAVSVIDPAISFVSDDADVLVIDRSQGVESAFTGNVSISGSSTLSGLTSNGQTIFGNTASGANRVRIVTYPPNNAVFNQIGDGTFNTGGSYHFARYLSADNIAVTMNTITYSMTVTGNVEIGTNASNTFSVTGIFDLGAFS